MFLQVHFLTSYHASLLNRDDAGLAKRISFGGVERLRVSSQCQKRHWSEWMRERASLPASLRTRYFFDRIIKRRLIEGGMDEGEAHELTLCLAEKLLMSGKGRDALDKETLQMNQPVLFGKPEADFLTSLIKDAAKEGTIEKAKEKIEQEIKEHKKNFRALLEQAGIKDPFVGLDGALFGRFVTSDILARVDAPVHVAHAFTVHQADTEVDFFTVVDDLQVEGETGAAHAGDAELGAGVFYGYVVVDIPLLVSNLTGCKRSEWMSHAGDDAKDVLRLLIQAIAQVSPGAKLGSTAPYSWAEHIVLETGKAQPRSFANAYLKPISMVTGSHPMKEAVKAMESYLCSLEKMYGPEEVARFVATIHEWEREGEKCESINEAVEEAIDSVFGGRE